MKKKPFPRAPFVVVWLTIAAASLFGFSSPSEEPFTDAGTGIPTTSLLSSLQIIYGAAHIESSFASLSTFQISVNSQTNNANDQQSAVGDRIGCVALSDLSPSSSSSSTSSSSSPEIPLTFSTTQQLQQALQQPSPPIQPLYINDTHVCYSTDAPFAPGVPPHLSLDFLVPPIMKGESPSLFPINISPHHILP